MFFITVNTFFAVILLVTGIQGYTSVAGKTIPEIGGPKLITILAVIAMGCALAVFSIYATVQLAITSIPG